MQPLSGVRVVEFCQVLAGPYCGMLLADLGAEVIKVEPPDGDMMRQWPPITEGANGGYSENFASINRNKRSVTLDLGSPQGREVVARLVGAPELGAGVAVRARPLAPPSPGAGVADVLCVDASDFRFDVPWNAKIDGAKSSVVRKTYSTLRGSAKKNVETAVPRLAKLMEKHAG